MSSNIFPILSISSLFIFSFLHLFRLSRFLLIFPLSSPLIPPLSLFVFFSYLSLHFSYSLFVLSSLPNMRALHFFLCVILSLALILSLLFSLSPSIFLCSSSFPPSQFFPLAFNSQQFLMHTCIGLCLLTIRACLYEKLYRIPDQFESNLMYAL